MTKRVENTPHAQYKNTVRKEKRIVRTWQVIIFVSFFMLWEITSRMHLIDPLLFSSPSKILTLLQTKFADGSMLSHVQITIFETLLGFLIGTIGGVCIASLLWASNRFSRIADPYLVILNAMPKVALGPIIIVALGPGMVSIISMGAIVSIIITTLVVYAGFNEVDPNYEKVLISFGASRWQRFKEAVFPATLPTMVSTLKVNVGLAWVGVIVGEFLVSKQGLGYLIVYGFQVFDFTLVMSSLLVIAIAAAIMYKIVEKIEGRLMKHTS